MKKLIGSTMVCLATLALFAGCQPQDSGSPEAPEAPEAPETPETPETPEAPAEP